MRLWTVVTVVCAVLGTIVVVEADQRRIAQAEREAWLGRPDALIQPPGCRGDWITGGTYCNRADGSGGRVASRAY